MFDLRPKTNLDDEGVGGRVPEFGPEKGAVDAEDGLFGNPGEGAAGDAAQGRAAEKRVAGHRVLIQGFREREDERRARVGRGTYRVRRGGRRQCNPCIAAGFKGCRWRPGLESHHAQQTGRENGEEDAMEERHDTGPQSE